MKVEGFSQSECISLVQGSCSCIKSSSQPPVILGYRNQNLMNTMHWGTLFSTPFLRFYISVISIWGLELFNIFGVIWSRSQLPGVVRVPLPPRASLISRETLRKMEERGMRFCFPCNEDRPLNRFPLRMTTACQHELYTCSECLCYSSYSSALRLQLTDSRIWPQWIIDNNR